MRIKCIRTSLTEKEKERLELPKHESGEWDGLLDIGDEYLVYSLRFVPGEKTIHGCNVVADIWYGSYLLPVPLCLFEIIDPRVSSCWEMRFPNNEYITLYPSTFYKHEAYINGLAQEVPWIMKDFEKVKELMENEFKDDPYIKI